MQNRFITQVGTLERSIQAYHADFLEETGLSMPGIEVLDQLYRHDGQRASDLARSIGRAATSFTPILDNLERAGCIERRPDPDDRRAVRIFLTKKGRGLKQPVTSHLDAVESIIKAELNKRWSGWQKSPNGDLLKTLLAPLPDLETIQN